MTDQKVKNNKGYKIKGQLNDFLSTIFHDNSEIIKKSWDKKNDEILKLYNSLAEFAELSKNVIFTEKEFKSRTAFLLYQYEAYHMAQISFREALIGNYTTSYILLRNYFELIIKGAFWECIAHKKYRKTLKSETKRSILIKGLLDLMIKENPEIEKSLETLSGSIFDKIRVIYEDPKYLNELIKKEHKKEFHSPSLYEMSDALSKWNIFEPINKIYSENQTDAVYDFYRVLSRYTHAEPEMTHIGRRLVLEKDDIFTKDFIEEDLEEFIKFSHSLVDLGMLIELNILGDLIIQNKDAITYIKRIAPIISDLELYSSYMKIEELLSDN